jgi:hypothetical protein
MSRNQLHTTAHYEITVEGELDQEWAESLGAMTITLGSLGNRPVSILVGSVIDQAALRGMICRLWDLNLTLVKLRRMEPPITGQGGKQDV